MLRRSDRFALFPVLDGSLGTMTYVIGFPDIRAGIFSRKALYDFMYCCVNPVLVDPKRNDPRER